MVFRRREAASPGPRDPRLAAARATIADHGADPAALDLIDQIDEAVATAREDRRKLEGSLTSLDPERAIAELKAALRRRESPTAPDTPEITALRKRHETISRLANRVDEIDAQITATLIDAETLAAQTIVSTLDRTEDAEFRRQLSTLQRDAVLLADAHRELADL
ncbi:MAG: hypothetical protein AAGE98_21665 [Actinomycetota bacterium]